MNEAKTRPRPCTLLEPVMNDSHKKDTLLENHDNQLRQGDSPTTRT